MLNALDLFQIGIGPSSSHTVGPMRIARLFLLELKQAGVFNRVEEIEVCLQGALALTGHGHGTHGAVILGLAGNDPETVSTDRRCECLAGIAQAGRICLLGERSIEFDAARHIRCDFEIPARHPNGMRLIARDKHDAILANATWYSIGGGFVEPESALREKQDACAPLSYSDCPYPYFSVAELLEICSANQMSIAGIVFANEAARSNEAAIHERLDAIACTMFECIDRGLKSHGILPGGLNVTRRAAVLWDTLCDGRQANDGELVFDYLNVYALAVNEENAAGGRIVTAPTNGAAGIIPSVMRHYCSEDGAEAARRTFLLTAAGIGWLYKHRASISGAEMGCQGEVGVACSMAAAGLAAVWNATPGQVATAAEIGMEHNLGLTCDPVGGLVQIPCIERNAIAAVKAVNAARMALRSAPSPRVNLDQVIETMRQTGIDMSQKYKETSQGGLAVNVVEC